MPRYTDHVKSPSPPNTNCMKTEVVKAAFDQVPAGCCVRKTARALIANWPRHRILREKLFFPPPLHLIDTSSCVFLSSSAAYKGIALACT